MIDDLALILTSVGAASGMVALLFRRRSRRQRTAWPLSAGARHFAEALSPPGEPLSVPGPYWRSLAETLEPKPSHPLD